MAKFFVNRPIVAMVLSIIMVMLGLVVNTDRSRRNVALP